MSRCQKYFILVKNFIANFKIKIHKIVVTFFIIRISSRFLHKTCNLCLQNLSLFFIEKKCFMDSFSNLKLLKCTYTNICRTPNNLC